MRSDPVETARWFVEEHFPEARAAIVGGSVIRGEGTPTSDLDIVLITDRDDAPLRASYLFMGWPIEAFAHTAESLPQWMLKDAARGRPSLCKMCAEGVVVRDDGGLAARAKAEAEMLLKLGPPSATPEEIEDRRYGLTDLLDDFLGAASADEGIFIANDLAVAIGNLMLLRHARWQGSGKWVPRALRQLDPSFTETLIGALHAYYSTGAKHLLIEIAERTLDDAGGRLFEGYYRSAKS